jgi:hypothetical protein
MVPSGSFLPGVILITDAFRERNNPVLVWGFRHPVALYPSAFLNKALVRASAVMVAALS